MPRRSSARSAHRKAAHHRPQQKQQGQQSSGRQHQQQRQKKKSSGYLENDENYPQFRDYLGRLQLELRDIIGDGNCLFRALGDQLDGNSRNHLRHRQETVGYMREHRDDFAPFVEDGVPLEEHLGSLAEPNTYAGNDAIVAFARLHKVTIVIHQLDADPLQIGPNEESPQQLHLAYHNGDHYSSIRRLGDTSESSSNIRIDIPAGGAVRPPWETWDAEELSDAEDIMGAAAASSPPNGVDDPGVNLVDELMGTSGCTDKALVLSTLEDHHYDIDATLVVLLQLMDGLELENGTQQSSGENEENCVDQASQQPWVTQGLTKRQRKQLKKQMAAEKRREALSGQNPASEAALNNDVFVIGSQLNVISL